ncbi:DNA-binding response OmpR family regulator [Sphingomicrobium lutaoense]|uniref:DNA-binding response OmpR family regulator n=1 Tax=Sphingomicrobium lutaoense TaxID=515949 RepID=A0A839Z458_9SPHN|nr:DNA-binding response OmpR family regulator [Sphingomicrobium lutaoense]
MRAHTGGSIPVMMLTGRTSRADEAIAYQAGADDYVRKPCDPDELLVRVEALLGAGQMRRHA